MVALKEVDALLLEQRRLLGGLNPLGNGGQAKSAGEAEEMAQDDLIVGSVDEVAHERAVDLDDIEGERLEVAQRSEAGAEIVERDAAAEVAHRLNETRRFVEVAQRRRLRDLDDEPARHARPACEQGDQRSQPRLIGRGQSRYVDAEIDVFTGIELFDRALENEPVDAANEAELLDRRNELAGGDGRAHPPPPPPPAHGINRHAPPCTDGP